MKQGSAGSCLSWQSSWAEEGRSSGQEELPPMIPDDAASSHLVSDEGIQLNSMGSDSFRQDTSIASQNRQNSLLDSSPSRRQGSPSLVGFSLRPSPRRNLANSPSRPESQPAFTNHQVQQSGIFQSVFGFFSTRHQILNLRAPHQLLRCRALAATLAATVGATQPTLDHPGVERL